MTYKIYNFCPWQTAQKIKNIFAICRKHKMKLVRFEEIAEEKIRDVTNSYGKVKHANCPYCTKRKYSRIRISNITTIIEFQNN